ncbi:ABC-F family ATP-binding cassette domain-containing protein [Desulfospira joergensenii]|uniref:ABC-F family ATP-binding cassette domain-containing protein n=1 Tax=Desulfospira joergensenii TaxID=53329 RepID=UPI0003B40D50|nr:ABC-F family ATP-binding cassette domain-containing protein [Desulfospira joergensenii]
MSVIFSIKEVSKAYGDDTLFSDLSFDFKAGEQMGLIGMNGSGKSTLLKLIAGKSLPDSGEIRVKPGERLVYLAQEERFDPEQTIEEILYHSLEKESQGSCPGVLDDREKHRRVNRSLGKGGFPDVRVKTKHLSGGWKKRLAITRALCMNPDLLLLDEPTNHLDLSGILWLETILKNADFSFVLVSHDRAFLENVCLNIMEIGPYHAKGYFKISGQYVKFERERGKFLDAQLKQQSSLANKMRREEEWLRQGPKARTSKAKFRIEQAEALRNRLDEIRKRNRQTARVDIDFSGTGRQTRKLLRAHNISKGFEEKPLFSGISFEIGPGFCLGVTGDNGSGKSTFLSILEQKSLPDSGTIKWAEGLKLAVFDQNRTRLDPEQTLRQALNPAGGDSVNYRGTPLHVVSWAKRFLFMPDQLDMPVKRLSGGEKARIILSNLMLQPCDILMLDEPTNDLDILSLEVLEQSIKDFTGGVIIVSHDRFLMDRVCHRILYLDPDLARDDGPSSNQAFQGPGPAFFKDFNQILKFRETKKALKPGGGRPQKKQKTKTAIKTAKAFSYKDKFELEHMEEKILDAETRVEEITGEIQSPQALNDPARMTELCTRLEQAESLVRNLYDRWEELETLKMNSE